MSLNFKDITLESKTLIESYTKPWNFESSELSFTNLFIWGIDGKMQYAEENNFLYIKLSFEGIPTFLWAPIPLKNFSFKYKESVYTAINYLKEQGVEPTIRSVGIQFKEMIESECPELIINETPMAFDYIYLSENLISLKGKKLHSKRNHINKFIHTNTDFKYKNLEPEMYGDCMKIYDDWSGNKDEESSSSLYDERKSVELALKNMKELNLVGGCIILNNKIEAFTLGERLTNDMQLIHIEKANPNINGLYPVINQQYALHNCSDVTFINREEDMGIEGMRKAKRSYYPIRMIEKFIVSMINPDEIENLWG